MFQAIRKLFSAEPDLTPTRIPGRNEACRCGSQKKYKNCCMSKDQRKAVR